ncbi:unnamed protein product [Dicrocoelium dendriticum]|nr:unnamed protein product [Dicrocoelium dendriticum]
MLNFALQSVGMPISGQANLHRICDVLTTLALTPASGAVGLRLAELTASCWKSETTMLREELESCAYHIVRESATRGSPINQMLTRLCSIKAFSVRHSRSASKTCLAALPSASGESAPVMMSSASDLIVSRGSTTCRPISAAPLKPSHRLPEDIKSHITTMDSSNSDHPDSATNGAVFSSHETACSPKHESPLDTLNAETQRLLTQMFQDTHHVTPTHLLRDSVYRFSKPARLTEPTEVVAHRDPDVVHSPSDFPPALVVVSSMSSENHVHYPQCSTETRVSNSTALDVQLDGNLIDICKPLRLFPESSQENSSGSISSNRISPSSVTPGSTPSNDEIRVDLRKAGNGSGRSVRLELLELLDLVLEVAKTSVSNTGQLRGGAAAGDDCEPHRPPVGLITQLLWRSRALDDRGPWILTFAIWWLMQHYFGIGSRVHHVRLRWGHLRLVSNVRDPMTDELCEAIEYVGPPEFITVKAVALLEHCGESETPVRRVYPSSGWAEAEMTIASALMAGTQLGHPKIRPLDTGPDVPPVEPRPGPNFVSLFKAFTKRRQQPSLLPDAPFYVQPLKSSPTVLNCNSSVAWFSVAALGKNRVGALMRNIVNRVVRPNLAHIASAATMSAYKACVEATQRTVKAVPLLELNPAFRPDVNHRLLVSKLSYILCLDMSVTSSSKTRCVAQQPSPCLHSNTLTYTQSADTVQPQPNESLSGLKLPLASGGPTTSTINCLPQTVPLHNTSFAQTTQLVGLDLQDVCARPQFQSYPCQTSSLLLLTSADGSSRQLIACQPSLQQPLQTNAQNGLVLIPTASANSLSWNGNLLRNVTADTSLPPQPLPVTGEGSEMRARQTIAYLAQRSSTSSNPISLILLSTNANDQNSATAPLLVNAINTSSDQSQQFYRPQAQIVAIDSNDIISTTADGTVFSPQYARPIILCADQPLLTFTSVPSTQLAVSIASDSVSSSVCPCTVATSAPFGYIKSRPLPHLEYSVTDVKPEQPSPTEDISLPTPITMRAIISDGQVINITQTSGRSPENAQVHRPVYAESTMFSQCTSEVDTTIDDLILLCSDPNRQEIVAPSAAHTPDDTIFLSSEYGPSHGVFPNTPSKDRTAQNGSTQIVVDLPGLSALTSQPANSPSTENLYDKVSTKSSDEHKNQSKRCSGSLEPLPPVSEMTAFSRPPEPRPDQLRTLQEAIDSARSFQCGDFPAYVEQLFLKGILSAHRPWLLNFCAWFINTVVFEVENRSDHVSLLWGDFRLQTTADGKIEYIYFLNRMNNRPYYLAAAPPSPYSLGLDEETVRLVENKPLPVRSPCPVAVFKTLRERRPAFCLQPTSKFYLQPRSAEDIDAIRKTVPTALHDWFTERPWGKNKLGSLLGEAAKMAGLPVICLRKQRARIHTPESNSAFAADARKVGASALSSSQNLSTTVLSNDPADLTTRSICSSSFSSRNEDRPKNDVKRRRMSHPQMSGTFTHVAQPSETYSSTNPVQLPSSSTFLNRSDSVLSS